MDKKKYLFIGIGVVVLFAIIASMCGGSKEKTTEEKQEEAKQEIVLKAAQTELKGDLKGCFEIVDKNYKIKDDGYGSDVIVVELKRTAQALPFNRDDVTTFGDAKGATAENCADFGIEILNADGDVIEKKAATESPCSNTEVMEALKLLTDETATIEFSFYNSKELKDGVSFRITSAVQKNEQSKKALEEEEAKKSKEKTSDEQALDDAEKALELAGKTARLAGKILGN